MKFSRSFIVSPYVLLIALLPSLTGLVIDSNLITMHNTLCTAIWCLMLLGISHLMNDRYSIKIITILYAVTSTIETMHWLIIKGPITSTSLLVISNTYIGEIQEFFILKGVRFLFIILPLWWFSYHTFTTIKSYNRTVKSSVLAIALSAVGLLFIVAETIPGRFVRRATPQILKTTLSYIAQQKDFEAFKKERNPKQVNAFQKIDQTKQLCVLIIGESCNRNHMSLYGYPRKTTPLLEDRTDLYTFTDVVSPYSNTIQSVLTILSEKNLEQPTEAKTNVDVVDVFTSAKFKTYWISNQPPIGVWENLIAILAKKSDAYNFVNIGSSSSMEATLTKSFDEKIFTPLHQSLKDTSSNKLIILHLMGNHSAYRKRYPKSFDKYKGTDKTLQTIAHYDNSVLYTDFIVDSIFNTLKQYSKGKTDLISSLYLSDHGENVYDYQGKSGHDYVQDLPKVNVEIPFCLWLSQTYINQFPLKLDAIKGNLHAPYVSDHLFHTLIDLNSIDYKAYDSTKSIINSHFNTKRKRILEDGHDYDLK